MEVYISPYRKKYYKIDEIELNKHCPFCFYKENGKYVVYEGKNSVVMLNMFPYVVGHLLIFPKRHVMFQWELNEKEREELFDLITKSAQAVKEVFSSTGVNVGSNQGKHAGNSIEHLHYHVLPRFSNHGGFLHVVCNATVVAESFEEVRELIKKKLEELGLKTKN